MLCNAFGILSFAHGIKIAAGTAAVVTGYLSAWFSALKTEDAGIRHKIMRNRIFALFLFYIILIVDFTLIWVGIFSAYLNGTLRNFTDI